MGTWKRRGARCGVELVQVVGLDAGREHGAEQGLQRRGAVVDAAQQHGLAQQRHAGAAQAGEGGVRRGRELARVVGVEDQPERLATVASAAASAAVTRAGSAFGTRVWMRSISICGIAARRADIAPSRRGDSISGSPPVRITSRIAGRARNQA